MYKRNKVVTRNAVNEKHNDLLVGKSLKELRKSFEYTQEYVATKIFVSRSCYSSWENNLHGIPLNKLLLLAKLYDINPVEFIKIVLGNSISENEISNKEIETLKNELKEIKTILIQMKTNQRW